MDLTKTIIRNLISEGKLESANSAALEYTEYCGLRDIANALTTLSSSAKDLHNKWNTGLISYDDYSLKHARISHGLSQWVDRLPDEPKPSGLRRKFLTEDMFKRRLLYLMLIIKALVLLRLSYHYNTGGFNIDQFWGTATLLVPALAAYIAVTWSEFRWQQRVGPQPSRYVSGPLVNFAYWLFPIYAVLLILFIELKTKGSISFTGMNLCLALVESVLGGYIGQMVLSFFRQPEESL